MINFDIPRWRDVNLEQQVIRRTGLLHKKCNKGCKGISNCKRGYPHPIVPETTLDARGFVQWKRPNKDSDVVVPHNIELSLLAGCHVNVRHRTFILCNAEHSCFRLKLHTQ